MEEDNLTNCGMYREHVYIPVIFGQLYHNHNVEGYNESKSKGNEVDKKST